MYDCVSALQAAREFLHQDAHTPTERAALYAAIAQIADQVEDTPGENDVYLAEQARRLRRNAGCAFGIDTGPSNISPIAEALGAIDVAVKRIEERQ